MTFVFIVMTFFALNLLWFVPCLSGGDISHLTKVVSFLLLFPHLSEEMVCLYTDKHQVVCIIGLARVLTPFLPLPSAIRMVSIN